MLEEIRATVSNCDNFKSPGPDEINFGFNKDIWDSLKVDMLNFFG